MDDARRVLRDLLRFFRDIEECDECLAPRMSFTGVHNKRWHALKERAEAAAVEPPKPN